MSVFKSTLISNGSWFCFVKQCLEGSEDFQKRRLSVENFRDSVSHILLARSIPSAKELARCFGIYQTFTRKSLMILVCIMEKALKKSLFLFMSLFVSGMVFSLE